MGSIFNLYELEACQVNDARHRYLSAKWCVCKEALYEITVTERERESVALSLMPSRLSLFSLAQFHLLNQEKPFPQTSQ